MGNSWPVKYCDVSLASAEENLACDEVLLDLCEADFLAGVLRFWEPAQHFVVVGYANQVAVEVNQDFCREHDIPVFRRCTGGGTVLQGPGCLNYSLILPIGSSPQLASIKGTNDYILNRHRTALEAILQAPINQQGYTDLTIRGLKFSGNAQRRKKDFVLFHGSFLLSLDIGLMQRALPLPSRQPDYRLDRTHADFLTNLEAPSSLLKAALTDAWQAVAKLVDIPLDQVRRLAREKYQQPAWNYKF